MEVEPSIKAEIYTALAVEGLTMKDWFLSRVHEYLEVRRQPTFFKVTRIAEVPGTASKAEELQLPAKQEA